MNLFYPNLYLIFCSEFVVTVEFGEIPNFSRQAGQAGKLRYTILYFHVKIQQRVLSILH